MCKNTGTRQSYQDKFREYLSCGECGLLFVPRKYFLSTESEKARYDQHKNFPNDKRYRKFLERLFTPMNERIAPVSCGMDFGSGPGPTLSVMFKEAGHCAVDYDFFYNKHSNLLKNKYDFITATEVVEHLHEPRAELEMLWSILKPGGWLGIMTNMEARSAVFDVWYYKNDPTHVCFFSHKTFEWLGNKWGAELVFADKGTVLLGKSGCKKTV